MRAWPLGVVVVAVALSVSAAGPDRASKWAGSKIAQDPRLSRHVDLEQMFADDKLDAGLAEAIRRRDKDPEDTEAWVHEFRFMFAIGERHRRDDKGFDKEAHYERMLEVVETGLKLEPGHPRLLWGRGIALARLGTTRGVLSSLRFADEIEAAWKSVVDSGYRYESIGGFEVLPCDAMVALGIFYRLVPDWWIVKVIAGTRGDINQSVNYLQRANRCRADGIGTHKELGAAYLCRYKRDDDDKDLARGKKTLQRGLKLEPKFEVQRIDHLHMRWLLEHPKEACGYSRDGQQDLDESALESESEVKSGSGGTRR